MRKRTNRRDLHRLQVMLLVMLALSVICSPQSVMGMTKTAAAEPFESCFITASEYEADNGTVKKIAPGKKTIFGKVQEKKKPVITYDSSVIKALSAMGAKPEHLAKWSEAHPNSNLKKIATLEPRRQKEVANIATFIRRINRHVDAKTAWREASAMVVYSMKYNISVDLLVALSKAESTFNPNAMSKKGAIGVMQVMWKVHHGMLASRGIATQKDHLFDPERGIEAGTLILSRYLNAYGTVQRALTRYYGGSSTAYRNKITKNVALLNKHAEKTGYLN